MKKAISSYHIGVAAEAFAAAQFARYGYDVSVQYGANQPEYDLIASKGDALLKVSVKGSQDGGWGLTQNYKAGCTYHEATAKWLAAHHKTTIFCLVQFLGVEPMMLPKLYLATPAEIAAVLDASAGGKGDTVLREYHKWGERSSAHGTIDKIPETWLFTEQRAEELFSTHAL